MPSLHSSKILCTVLSVASVLMAALAACARTGERYYYCRTPDWRGDYVFEVPFSGGHAYDIYIFTRAEGKDRELLEAGSFPMYVEAVSPSGVVYGEKYDLAVPAEALRNPRRMDVMVPYRMGAAPMQEGLWTVRLRLCGRGLAEITEGFGLYIEEQDR